jgi:hypothetical protein
VDIGTFVANLTHLGQVEKIRQWVATEDIPDLDLGERRTEIAGCETHRTERKGGYVKYVAVGGEGGKKRKRKCSGGVGARKRRAVFKKGGERKRGEDGRFVRVKEED